MLCTQGAGTVPALIHSFFPDTRLTGYELDPAVVQAARDHFQLGQSGHLVRALCHPLRLQGGLPGS